jgi:hypothetical protein
LRLRWIGLALAVTLLSAATTWGQVHTASVARIKLLNKNAMDEYDGLEFEAAKTILLEAVQVAREGQITKGPALVTTFLNLGMVYGAGLNDRINAIKYFTQALRLDPRATLSATRATPTLEEMFKTAKESVGTVAPPAEGGFRHTPVDEAIEGRALRLRARVGEELGAKQVLLFYRVSGTAEFERIAMSEDKGGLYVGIVPGEKVTGRSLYYYIEAQDEAGARVAGHGSAESPNSVSIRAGGGGSGPGPTPRPAAKRKVFSIGVFIGTGVGVVYGDPKSEHPHPQTGAGDEKVDIKPGVASAPLHIAPELSYHITNDWHLSGLVRIQVVNAISSGLGSQVSVLGELRAKRYFGKGPVRAYFAFGAGGGQIRHRIPLGDYDSSANLDPDPTPDNSIVDTRVAGLGCFGFGGGVSWMFSSYVGLAAEVNAVILVPDFASHADLNVGLVFAF